MRTHAHSSGAKPPTTSSTTSPAISNESTTHDTLTAYDASGISQQTLVADHRSPLRWSRFGHRKFSTGQNLATPDGTDLRCICRLSWAFVDLATRTNTCQNTPERVRFSASPPSPGPGERSSGHGQSETTRHDEALDLTRAFADLEDLRVPVEPRHRVVFDEAAPAEDLRGEAGP